MTRVSAFVGVTVDGFIARPDGGLDFLDVEGPAVDAGFNAFLASVDVLVMGRNTYEAVRGFDVPWPYGVTPVIVITSRPLDIPQELSGTVEVSSLSPQPLVDALAGRGFRHLYIDGGRTIQSFLAAGVVTDVILTWIPILIGEGISLFGPLADDLRLDHTRTTALGGGMVQSHYRVLASAESR